MWVEDLLDPPVPQGKELLVQFDDNGEPERACCLGILTLRAIKEGVEGVRIHRRDPRADGRIPAEVEFLTEHGNWSSGHDEQLPPPVARWAGLMTPGGSFDTNPELSGNKAITRNDDRSDSFEDIAKAIEKDPRL